MARVEQDVLITGVPDEMLAAIDAKAARLDLTRAAVGADSARQATPAESSRPMYGPIDGPQKRSSPTSLS